MLGKVCICIPISQPGSVSLSLLLLHKEAFLMYPSLQVLVSINELN